MGETPFSDPFDDTSFSSMLHRAIGHIPTNFTFSRGWANLADMKPSELLELHREEIRAIVLQNNALNPRVFGSVLSGTDTETSDLDLLIEPLPGMSLFDIGAIRYELKELLKIEVDVLTPGALPDQWKDVVLQEAKPI